MLTRFTVLLGAAGLIALSACTSDADRPAAVYPEPVFNKVGASGEGECPPGYDRTPLVDYATNYVPQQTPIPCCPEGYAYSQERDVCMPIPQRPDDNGDTPERDIPGINNGTGLLVRG
ncbi:hypothetical protein [Aliiroseovarius subalbicans]|uniref:hypothetical protein n=1 Tax=Aliiroseovarius subalbicans TaxID=2925840 RepID=UPI001F58682D|nr:hypothetical protein [Aliiroseovarius subalbicans]MCI2400764.1 hypothetical protein [Aliiroseovarius subalbicans]